MFHDFWQDLKARDWGKLNNTDASLVFQSLNLKGTKCFHFIEKMILIFQICSVKFSLSDSPLMHHWCFTQVLPALTITAVLICKNKSPMSLIHPSCRFASRMPVVRFFFIPHTNDFCFHRRHFSFSLQVTQKRRKFLLIVVQVCWAPSVCSDSYPAWKMPGPWCTFIWVERSHLLSVTHDPSSAWHVRMSSGKEKGSFEALKVAKDQNIVRRGCPGMSADDHLDFPCCCNASEEVY